MEKIISVYWFAILFLVAGGIYVMVISFYGHSYDVRELEAKALSEKVASCISYGGVLNPLIYNEIFNESFEESFLEVCNLNFKTEDFWKEGQYYVLVEFFDINENLVFEFDEGNFNLKADCEIKKENYERLNYCSEDRFYTTSSNSQFLVKIITIINKNEKNVE